MELSYQLTQKQILSQQQIESLNILSMDMQELEDFLTEEQNENPVLNFIVRETPRTTSYSSDDNNDRLHSIPAPKIETAADILLPQLNTNLYTQDETNIFELIADFTDSNGFLTVSPEEIFTFYKIPPSLFHKCLNVMQELDPPGVCSRTLEECLLRQLGNERDETLAVMIRHHLADIAEGKLHRIAKALKIDILNVHKYIQTIRALNPRPLNGLLGEKAGNIIPDIILIYENDSWSIELNDSWIGKLEICDWYAALAAGTTDAALREYLKTKIQRIRFLNESIERRRNTLMRIGACIAERQSDFLLHNGPIVAFSMTNVADKLGIHLSTVSRAIKGKYLQYPGGVLEIRAMLAQRVPHANAFGEASGPSREGAKKYLKDLISGENREKPYSDSQLAALLKKLGIELSRRAVTKYRKELDILGMHGRRST